MWNFLENSRLFCYDLYLIILASLKAIRIIKLGHKEKKKNIEIFFEIGENALKAVSERQVSSGSRSKRGGKGKARVVSSESRKSELEKTVDDVLANVISQLDLKLDEESALYKKLRYDTQTRLNHFQNVCYTRGLFAAMGKRSD